MADVVCLQCVMRDKDKEFGLDCNNHAQIEFLFKRVQLQAMLATS